MILLGSDRNTGKTTHLLSWLERESNRILIVHSAQERARILKEYPDSDYFPNRIVTIQHVLDGRLRGRHPRPEFAIDNLDLILPYIIGGSIGPVTYTENDERPRGSYY